MFNQTRRTCIVLATIAMAFFSQTINAAVVFPALGINSTFGGAGVSSVNGNLVIDATAYTILTSPSTSEAIPPVTFTLNAVFDSFVGNTYSFTNGTLTAGSYVTATFDSLTLSGSGQFSASLTYTDGTLVTSGASGSFDGSLFNPTSTDFSGDFTANPVIATVSPVVPIPAAMWLFGSGLLGLVGIARRKKA